MKLSVDQTIFEKFPGVRLGVVVALKVDNRKSEPILNFLRQEEKAVQRKLLNTVVSEHEFISPWREAYRNFGSKPNEFSSSVEALAKRVQKGKELPDINPLVNLYNALSLKYLLPFGGEDLDRVKGDIRLAFANGTERGKYIGSDKADACYLGEVAYLDELGFICRRWNWREADRTKLTPETKNVVLVAEALSSISDVNLKQATEELSSLLKENLGGKTSVFYLDQQNPTLEIDFITGTKLEKPEIDQSRKKIISTEKNDNLKTQKKLVEKISEQPKFYFGSARIIYDQIKKSLKDLGLPDAQISLEHPAVESHGDYSSNIALTIFPSLRSANWWSGNLNFYSPRQLAELIVENLKKNSNLQKIVSKIEVAGPGFINFYLKPSVYLNELEEINKLKDKYGSSSVRNNKVCVIDYSAPNIAKRFTIGHLRSTIIGQSIYNLYKFLGWKVIGDNHLGDWGTQFGKMIIAIQKWADKPISKLSIEEMESLYVKFHQEAEKDPELDKLARQAFKNLEDGQSEEHDMWQRLVDKSMEEFQKIYDLLNVNIDYAYGESFYWYQGIMSSVVNDALRKKVAIKSKGALIIPYPKEKLPPSMLLKSDGATTYLTRDLATIKFRKEKWNPDLMIYEVGAEQSLHFKQVFWAAELLGYARRDKFSHIPHGLIRLKEGKMSTRKGNVIKLEQVLAESILKAKKYNSDPNISQAVGIGAVKYNDLKRSPSSGYTFNWDETLNLDGNSGPYLQYTYARARSVIARSPESVEGRRGNLFNFAMITNYKPNSEELAILRWIYRFPEIVAEAAKQYAPNLICNFLFELAQRFNTFYNKHRILVEGSHPSIKFRLLLTAAVAQVLKNGLSLLGIEAPKKM